MIRICKIFLLLLFIPCLFLAQENLKLSPAHPKDFQFDKKIEQNLPLLVAELTKGKADEVGKFKAIFYWTVFNIKYDYRAYFATGGSYVSIPHIVKSKRALCIDYAALMDTLCHLAGVENTTVLGYATDELFDVHDSVYIDNHAWNAVKLNGLWYLYDATWSTGHFEYKPTRFSRFLLKQLGKDPKYKQKKVRVKRKRKEKSYCPETSKSSPPFYYKQRFFNKLYQWLLTRFKIKINRSYNYSFNTDFFLAPPEIFGITHFPDDPIWAFKDAQKISLFENDSAYYFLTDSTYKNQLPQGRACAACDAYADGTSIQKTRMQRAGSESFNPKNKFISTYCDFDEARYYLDISRHEDNDSIRLLWLDTSKSFFIRTKYDLSESKKFASRYYKEQKKKNNIKQKLEKNENKLHDVYVRKKLSTTLRQRRNFAITKSRSVGLIYAYNNKAEAIQRQRMEKILKGEKLSPVKKYGLEARLAIANTGLDSLYKLIPEACKKFDSVIYALMLNIKQVYSADSVRYYIRSRTNKRRRALDNYKKPVHDVSTQLFRFEKEYTEDIDNLVYNRAEAAFRLFKNITKNIQQKMKCERDLLAIKKKLVRGKVISETEWDSDKENILKKRKEDFCWMWNAEPYIWAVWLNYHALQLEQAGLQYLILTENMVERGRQYNVNRELGRRYRQYSNIISSNNSSVRFWLREIKLQKRRSIDAIKRKKKQMK